MFVPLPIKHISLAMCVPPHAYMPKGRKIDIFPKGLTLGFGPKMAISLTFFLGNICRENVFYDILERKAPF